MFKNYIKVAFRNLFKQKEYAFINILGLSIGMACCLLIALFVLDEYSYDNFHSDGDRIYRMSLERKYPDHSTFYAVVPHSFSEVLTQDYPEIEATCKLNANNANVVFRYEDQGGDEKIFEEDRFFHADSNFFNFFSVRLLKGNPNEVLTKPNTIVITESAAAKYFGDREPIGQVLKTDFAEYDITGVCEDLPDNSHFKFDLVGSWRSLPFSETLNYLAFSACTYLRLDPLASPAALEQKLPQMVETYAAAQVEERLQISFQDYVAAGNGYRYFLQPLRDIHLKSNLEGELGTNGDITVVYIFISIAIFILVIASINFMNLATARSADRAREVGVRKVMGSGKQQLIKQFLSESMVISFISLLFAVSIVTLSLPYFNRLFNNHIELDLPGVPFLLPAIIFFTVLVGLLAGIYPAFVLSSFNPVNVLKGKLIHSSKGSWLRNGLVTFQFFISIVLIAGILVIYQQMEFLRTKNLGYNKDHVLIIDRITPLGENWQAFDKEVLNLPGVKKLGHANTMPGSPSSFFFGIQFQPKGVQDVLTTKGFIADDHFIDALELEMVQGRAFSPDIEDSLSIILNQSAVKTLGINNPVGAQLVTKGNNPFAPPGVEVVYTIVGVVKDFNFQSLRDEISPLVLLNPGRENPINFAAVAIKISPENINQTINAIENKWKSITENEPFRYSFLDQDLLANYRAEQNSSQLLTIFTGLAILIACIGLFGLAAFISQQRTKEIGVRKVLGASVFGVVVLLSKDFTKLVLVAFIVSIPVAWYFIDQWLENFAYSVDISLWVFVISGFTALAIALITVSYQALKTAIVNPVKSLKSE